MMVAQPYKNGVLPGKDALAAAFDWWREAGVDFDYADTANQWLRADETDEAVTSPPVPLPKEPARKTALERALGDEDAGRIGGNERDWPQDLPAFHNWWLTEKSLSDASEDRREPPIGARGAEIAVLTPFPLEVNEQDFLAAILRAFGSQEMQVYRASAVPAAIGLPDWQELRSRGLAALTRHHMALAQPKRLLVFDRGLAPLFDIGPSAARTPTVLELGARQMPLMLAPALADLMRSPERRKTFWNRWLEWTA
ncbi:hypothetical protein E3U23_03670 [Erythrobacter litoralis]|uniref:hypothetical protein n=1 Tax=Erythrobacter litoralis TaxID=39960 RepID=UPI00243536A7|nr:hypothetical protein [Erythrobacter litoralis]MDG6078287.1 hypothetical protein [Erythrobacter litoralis]